MRNRHSKQYQHFLNVDWTDKSKMEPPKRKRRWFQSSLRTLMVMVTLLAVPLGYMGWQVKIVHRREAMKSKLIRLGGECRTSSEELQDPFFDGKITVPKLPWIRELLGDEPMWSLYIPQAVSKPDTDEITTEFPEAVVSRELNVVKL